MKCIRYSRVQPSTFVDIDICGFFVLFETKSGTNIVVLFHHIRKTLSNIVDDYISCGIAVLPLIYTKLADALTSLAENDHYSIYISFCGFGYGNSHTFLHF